MEPRAGRQREKFPSLCPLRWTALLLFFVPPIKPFSWTGRLLPGNSLLTTGPLCELWLLSRCRGKLTRVKLRRVRSLALSCVSQTETALILFGGLVFSPFSHLHSVLLGKPNSSNIWLFVGLFRHNQPLPRFARFSQKVPHSVCAECQAS